jgi:DeoR/GlpR family transcriptional regulator of sugar metabolism
MSQATTGRRQQIMAQLLEKQQVTVKSLAIQMGVSDATVRRDLKALAGEQGLVLVHGGAILPRERDFSYQAKQLRAAKEKRIIGRLAAGLVHSGDRVFLDSGTTCSEMAPHVKQLRDLTILVNSARLALELTTPGIQLFLIGGQYRPDRMDTVGPMAENALNQVRGYVAFIGADGLSMDFGPSAIDSASAYLHHQVIQNASATVLLVDHSKFGNAAMFKIVDWSQIGTVVTDSEPGAEWLQFLGERNIAVVFPREGSDSEEESPLTSGRESG